MEFFLTYLFDGAIFALALTAFLLSKEPKQTAILVCLFVSIIGAFINITFPIEYIYSSLGILEAIGFLVLLVLSLGVSSHHKVFFNLMMAFLFISVANNCILIPLYKYYNVGSFSIYTYCYQAIAIAHVLTMLAFSDVIGSSIRNMRNTFSNWNRRSRRDFRHQGT